MSKSDTEILLKLLGKFWVKTLDKIDGMWSFVYFSKKKNKLFVSRDNFGEKPLFYYSTKNNFYFGSTIDSIKDISNQKFNLNYSKLNYFLKFGFRSFGLTNESFYQKIKELNAGKSLIINKNLKITEIKNYFLSKNVQNLDNINSVKDILIDSIKSRFTADCKMGLLLSGGIDSNLIAHIGQKK